MTGCERLRALSELNRYRPPETHTMHDWVCGTQCCTAGFAAQHRVFQDEGLRAETNGVPAYGWGFAFTALAKFFGVEYRDAEYIFSPDFYNEDPSPARVSDRIDEFLQENEPCGDSLCSVCSSRPRPEAHSTALTASAR